MRWPFLIFLGLMVAARAASAQVGLPWPGPGTHAGGGASYTGPGDIVSFTRWGGMRAYSAATRGTKAINLCNVGDVVCVDVNSSATTGIVSSTQVVGSVTCGTGANQCTVQYIYDQAGTSNWYGGGAASVRPQFKPNCVGTLPCMTTAAASTQYAGTSTVPSLSQPYSTSVVMERTGSFTSFNHGYIDGGQLSFLNSANTIYAYAGATVSATASDSALHAVQGVFNSPSCHLYIDGSDTTGDCGANASGPGASFSSASAPADAIFLEGGTFAAAFSSGNMSSLNGNQHSFWGF